MHRKHSTTRWQRSLIIPLVSLALSGCLMEEEIEDPAIADNGGGASGEIQRDHRLTGSVGDGPVVGADVSVFDRDGSSLGTVLSGGDAGYNLTVSTTNTQYPLSIVSRGGTDLVTGLAPDFTLQSTALEQGDTTVANLNPFSTLAVEAAGQMNGGLNAENVSRAVTSVTTALNSGLTTLAGPGVIRDRVVAANIAEMVKASETLGETIRRTRDALEGVGRRANGDSVVRALASDLIDGDIDGRGGPDADARVAAVARLVAAQVLLEAIANRLQVNGADAMSAMDDAITVVMPGASGVTTSNVPVSGAALNQIRAGLLAANEIMPSPELDDLMASVASLGPGLLPSAVAAVVPATAPAVLDNVVVAVADGSQADLDVVNGNAPTEPPNTPPVISGTPPATVDEGTAYSFAPTASDADGDPLLFDIVNLPAWASFNTANGQLAGTPGAGDVGVYSGIVITVSDAESSASLGPFSIEVRALAVTEPPPDEPPPDEPPPDEPPPDEPPPENPPANSAPSISGNPSTAVNVGSAYSFTPSASDADGDTLAFDITNMPAWAVFDTATGRLSGTPQPEDVGRYANIVISVSDGQASAALAAFTIDVEAISLGSVTLSWTPPTENTDGTPLTDLAGYRIYWGDGSGSYPNSVTLENPGLTTYVVENLAPGTYEFVATSYNSAGVESDYSAPATKTVQP